MSNNEFDNPGQEPELDPDMDFGEFEEKKSGSSLGDVWKSSPIVKLGLIAGALVVVVGAVALFGGENTKVETSAVGSASDLKQSPGMQEVSPTMKQALEESNQQRIEQAVSQGESVFPTPIEPPKTLLPVPAQDTQSEDPLVRWRQLQEERIRIQREQEQQAEKRKREVEDPKKQQSTEIWKQAMVTQITQIVSAPKENTLSKMTVTDMAQLQQQSGAGVPGLSGLSAANLQQLAGAVQQQPGMIAPELSKVVIPAGEIEYAQLLVEANSDIPGPIVALMASGPFSGARMMGSFSKKEEYIVMQFTSITGKDGNSIPIQAYAVDPDTTLTGMATDVDHRYLERIILPVAAKFIEGVGSAIAESGSTTVAVEGETVTSSQEDLDLKQEVFKGVENAAQKIGEIFDEEGNKTEILVRVRAGTPMGLLFTQPVTEQAVKQSQYVQVPQEEQTNPLQGLLLGGGNGNNNNNQLLQALQMQQLLQNIQQQPNTAGAQQ
jgi:intracellular multiplication protein IcmE